MYHFVKSIADAGNSFAEITETLLDLVEFDDCPGYCSDLLDRVLMRSYVSDWYPSKKYGSKATMYLLRHYCMIRNCGTITLEDYLGLARMNTIGLIDMIRYRNFTEESEARAREIIDSIKQEDLIYLGPENSCYAMPFILINGRHIPVMDYINKKSRYEFPRVPYIQPEYTQFAEDITDPGIGNDNWYYYYTSRGYEFNTDIMDGSHILCVGDQPEDLEFIKKMINISANAAYISATSKNMDKVRNMFPEAIFEPIDIQDSVETLEEYVKDRVDNSSQLFEGTGLWEYYTYDYLKSSSVNPGQKFELLDVARYYQTYEIETERILCMINLIHDGHTICSDLLGPSAGIYNMINRIKFGSFKMTAYRDITIIC